MKKEELADRIVGIASLAVGAVKTGTDIPLEVIRQRHLTALTQFAEKQGIDAWRVECYINSVYGTVNQGAFEDPLKTDDFVTPENVHTYESKATDMKRLDDLLAGLFPPVIERVWPYVQV